MFNMKESPVSVTYALLSPDPSHLVCNVLHAFRKIISRGKREDDKNKHKEIKQIIDMVLFFYNELNCFHYSSFTVFCQFSTAEQGDLVYIHVYILFSYIIVLHHK